MGRASAQKLTGLRAELDKLCAVRMGGLVPLAKTSDCREQGKVKLVVSFFTRVSLTAVSESLMHVEADCKQVVAPTSHLDRVVHAQLAMIEGLKHDRMRIGKREAAGLSTVEAVQRACLTMNIQTILPRLLLLPLPTLTRVLPLFEVEARKSGE